MDFRYTGNCGAEVNEALAGAMETFQRNIGPNLKGLYLHGSMAMGCFRPWSSDIDLLAVVYESMDRDSKLRLVNDIMAIAESGSEFISFEFSIVTAGEAARAAHPLDYILHYSNGWHQRYKDGKADYVVTGGADEDLTAHFMVTRQRGFALCGAPIVDTFGVVSREDYLKAVWYDIVNSEAEAPNKPMYTVLNLCRTLMYLETGRVGSKLEGGQWAAGLPELAKWKPVIDTAISEYSAGITVQYDAEALLAFVRHMMARCNELR